MFIRFIFSNKTNHKRPRDILVITHSTETICDKIIWLPNGQLLQQSDSLHSCFPQNQAFYKSSPKISCPKQGRCTVGVQLNPGKKKRRYTIQYVQRFQSKWRNEHKIAPKMFSYSSAKGMIGGVILRVRTAAVSTNTRNREPGYHHLFVSGAHKAFQRTQIKRKDKVTLIKRQVIMWHD